MDNISPGNVFAAGIVLPVVGIAVLSLRFLNRVRHKQVLGIDDWVLVPGLVLLVGMGAALTAGVALRALAYPTPHTDNPDDPLASTNYNITVTSQVEWALFLMQVLQIACVKLSFLFFYRRVLLGPSQKNSLFSHLTWVGIGLVVAWALAFFFAILLSCAAYSGSFSAWWGSDIDLTTKCIKTEKMLAGLGISDFLMDLYIMLLPIHKIWSLHITTGRKLGVLAVFSLGLVAVVASIIRMVFYIQAATIGFSPTADEDLIITNALYWSMVESGLAFIAVCLPSLRQLFSESGAAPWLASVRSMVSLRSVRSGGSVSSGGQTGIHKSTSIEITSAPRDLESQTQRGDSVAESAHKGNQTH